MTDISPAPAGFSDQAAINWNIQTPTDWATAQLEYMGLPVTNGNIEFLVAWAAHEGGNWNNTARFNPLNTTQAYAGSTVMSGGNSAGVQSYSSWQNGIAAIAQTLMNGDYNNIVAGLKGGDAINNQGNMGSELSTWSGAGYTSVGGPNTSYAGDQNAMSTGATTGGQAGQASPNAGGMPQAPGMNDIPALKQYIATYDPTFAWLLNEPGVAQVLMQAVANQDDTNQIQAAIEQTEWWKTTSQAVKTYQNNLYQNPADYGPQAFNTPGSIASQTLAQVNATAAQQGVKLTGDQAQTLAQNYMQYGWNSAQLEQALGSYVTYNAKQGGTAGQTGAQTNAGGVIQQLQAEAGQYLLNVSPSVLQSWAQNIVGGTQTMQQWQAYLAQNASVKWQGMSSMIQQGMTPNQIVDQYRQDASQIMEVDPNSVDFVNNPMYAKVLDYVPPGETTPRMMTTSEMQQYLKSQPQWMTTQNARNSFSTLGSTIATTWGIQ